VDHELIIKKLRGFYAIMARITEFRFFRFILQWEMLGPGPRFVDHGLGPVHGGPARWRGWEVTRERPGWGSGLPVLTGGGREGKRRCEELTTRLIRARGATERWGDEGEVVVVVGLDGSVLRCEGEGVRGIEGCRIAPGWRWPFIGAGGRRGRPETAGGGGNWRLHGCHYRE
jgi:hypothetical protein